MEYNSDQKYLKQIAKVQKISNAESRSSGRLSIEDILLW